MKIKYILSLLVGGLCAACVDDKEYRPQLPEAPVREVKEYALPVDSNKTFIHPGCMVSQADFDRAARHLSSDEPWKGAFEALKDARWFNDNDFPRTDRLFVFNGERYLIRGTANKEYYIEAFSKEDEWGEGNFAQQSRDCSVAWSNAVYWKLTDDRTAADKAVTILNTWAAECKDIVGDNNVALGVMGSAFSFASIGELLRDYDGWKAADQAAFKEWLVRVHVQKMLDFLDKHQGFDYNHYWSNWDLGNMLGLMAVGVYCDRADLYNRVIDYITYGKGNSNWRKFIPCIHSAIPGEDDIDLGQTQESGRDQGHNRLCIQLASAICRIAWNQGDDLYGYDDNRFLKAAEYVAKYNYGPEMEEQQNIVLTYPFQPLFIGSDGTYHSAFGPQYRGAIVNGFLSIYEHYRKHKGIESRYVRWARNPVENGSHRESTGRADVMIEGETFDHDWGDGFGHGTLLFMEEN